MDRELNRPVDCFITSHSPRTPEREYAFALTQVALHANGFNPIVIEEKMLDRYFKCDEMAESEIYIMCDNDIIPATPDTLNKLVNLMYEYPILSQLGLGWRHDLRQQEVESWVRGTISDDVWEMDHVGGCMAIRKGTIPNLGYECDYENGIGDDKIVAKIAREMGYKVGLAPKLWFHHLGGPFSTLWKQ